MSTSSSTSHREISTWRAERGTALIVVLLCATLFLALGGALVVVASTEVITSAAFRDGTAALAAAEAAAIRTFADLATAPNLDAVLAGTVRSTFTDGPADGPRRLPDGTVLDLAAATQVERCGAPVCTDAQLDAVSAERPWGVNNPRWQLYGSGWLRDATVPPLEAPHVFTVVWIGDDPLETDGNPLTDAVDVHAPGHEVVVLRAVAYAARGARRRVEIVAHRHGRVVRPISWREVRY